MIKDRTLIIPGLHHKVLWVDNFLKSQTYTELVFLGDYFDTFNDNVTWAQKTAYWLKYALEDYPNATFLLGNHDVAYRFPLNRHLFCSGFTREKCDAINKILTSDEWSRLKLCHFTQGFLCSHAGVGKGLYQVNPTIEDIELQSKKSLEYAQYGQLPLLLGAGRARYGRQPIGGVIWCDWNEEFEPLDGINQIVGHTPNSFVRTKYQPDSQNYCIDTHAAHVGVIEDGVSSYIESGCPDKGKAVV